MRCRSGDRSTSSRRILFPGIPPEVLRPRSWGHLLWVAPSGAGRTLVARLLQARALAACGRKASAPPSARPAFLELDAIAPVNLTTLATGVCIAVPEGFSGNVPPGTIVVRSTPVASVLEPLVAWARARLSASSTWDEARMARALEALAERGLVQSAGDALGFIGLGDELGVENLEQRALARLAREWLARRANQRLERGSPATAFLKRSGFDALVALARRIATDSPEPLACPRSLEEWAALLPPELRQDADLEWLKAALARAEAGLTPAAVERATRALPPGAFRILRAFEAIGVLEREGDDRLALRPHWLLRVVEEEALDAIVSGPAFDWGDALLRPVLAPRTAERLFARAVEGALSMDELAEPERSKDPATAAAIEGGLRALGVAALVSGSGIEPPEAVWDEQMALLVELDGDAPPRPRWDHVPREGRGAWLLTRGAFYLALLSLGELLGAHEGLPHPILRPWHATTAPRGLARVLDAIRTTLERADTPRAVIGPAVALVARLRSVLGPLGADGEPHALERAPIVADETTLGVLDFASVAALSGDRVGLAALVHLLQSRRIDDDTFAAAVFQAFERAGAPLEEAAVLFEPELAPIVLPRAPVLVLSRLLPGLVTASEPPPLTDEQWVELFDGRTPLESDLYRFVPAGAVDAAVDAACEKGDRAALEHLWARFPAALADVARAALSAPGDGGTFGGLDALLESAPPRAAERLFEGVGNVDQLLRAPAESLMALRRHLYRRLAARGPGFRESYALFDEIERRCAKVSGI